MKIIFKLLAICMITCLCADIVEAKSPRKSNNHKSNSATIKKLYEKAKEEQANGRDSAAIVWIEKAARLGDAGAQYELAKMYMEGYISEEPDYNIVVKWLRKAAVQGHTQAQYQLGEIYLAGLGGVNTNHAEAVKWFRKAALHGFPEAQRELGRCYYKGFGVSQDYHQAVKWLRKAADQGAAEAKELLATVEPLEQKQYAQKPATPTKPAANNPKPTTNNSTARKHYYTGYYTSGYGWMREPNLSTSPIVFNISNDKIISDKGHTYTYVGQISLFGIPVQSYVNNTESNSYLLRNGSELMWAYTMQGGGLMLCEILQDGTGNKTLNRQTVLGQYANNSTTFQPSYTPQQSSPQTQSGQRVCGLCNGWGTWKIVYAPQYSTSKADYWCRQCGRYDYQHHHERCTSCGGTGRQ